MKLPEYDNRPPSGTPLYSDPDSGSGLRFGLWALLAVVLVIGGVGTFIWSIFFQ